MYYCPWCGESAPYGDQRWMWVSAHVDNILHRLWWSRKKKRIEFLEEQLQRIIRMEKGTNISDAPAAADLVTVIQVVAKSLER